jgi:NADPH-dependent 2,4-dienoyl-CoA reductase/sulfur reductase-like enzyme/nitrite reductase/ring-hydroxylating ferredoxin subunit
MTHEAWRRVCSSEEISEGDSKSFELSEDEQVLISRRNGQLFACSNACTHLGAPLSDGAIHGDVATCPWHNARFNVRTGEMLTAPALDDLPLYEVREDNGEISVGAPRSTTVPIPSGSDDRHFVIVGGGAAGTVAVESLRREGFAGKITLVSRDGDRPYDRTLLSKVYLSKDMPDEKLVFRSEAFYRERNVDLMLSRTVVSLEPEKKTLTLDDGTELRGDAILLATGSRPVVPPIEGIDREGVYTLRSLEDARAIRGAASTASRAVVVGASFIGTEVADSLIQRGLEVHLVAPEAVPMEQVFGRRIGERFRRMHEERGTQFHLGRNVRRIADAEDGAAGTLTVELDEGTALETDLVVVGTGVSPELSYLEGTGLVEAGAVPVDDTLESRAEGIFAAGDIAAIDDGAHARRVRAEHWIVAQRQAQHAARAMLGRREAYPFPPFFWTKQLDASFKYVGYAPDYEEILYRGDPDDGAFLAGYFRGGTLRAVAGLGSGAAINRAVALFEQGRRVSKAEFSAGELP